MIAESLYKNAEICISLGRLRKAISIFNIILDLFKCTNNLKIQKIIIETQFHKGQLLVELEKNRSAIKTINLFLNLNEKTVDTETLTLVGLSLFNKAFVYTKLEKYSLAKIEYEKFLERFKNSSNARLQEVVAKTLNNLATIHIKEGNLANAINFLDTWLITFKEVPNAKLQIQVAMAFFNKANLLPPDNAVEVCDEFLKYFENTSDTSLTIWLVKVLYFKSRLLITNNNLPEAIQIIDSIFTRFRISDNSVIQTIVALAQTDKIDILRNKQNVNEIAELINACDKFLNQFENNSIPEIEKAVAHSFYDKIIALISLRKEKDAHSVFKTLLNKFENSKNQTIQEILNEVLPLNWNWTLEWVNLKLEQESKNFEFLDIKRHALWEVGKYSESIEINKLMINVQHPDQIKKVLLLLEALALMNEVDQFEVIFQKFKEQIEADENNEYLVVDLRALQTIIANNLLKAKDILVKTLPDTTFEYGMYFLTEIWSFEKARAFIPKLYTNQQKQFMEHLINYFCGNISGNKLREFLSQQQSG